MKSLTLNDLAEIAEPFCAASNTANCGDVARWPLVCQGSLFGISPSAAFFAGEVDLPDGWIVPSSLDLHAWLLAIREGHGAAKRMEDEAMKSKEWKHVFRLDNDGYRKIPPVWNMFQRSIGKSIAFTSINPSILHKFAKASAKLNGKEVISTSLVPSADDPKKPLHIFVDGWWRGVIMPLSGEGPFNPIQMPEPRKYI